MVLENKYLIKAIQKAGYVVIVKTCYIHEKKSKLEYVSPNASTLGMNVELLNKGMKLTEDYIYPEDREKVIETIFSALDSKVKEYTHEYRMVGDDGTLHFISNEISITDVNEETFRLELYIKDISANKHDNFLGLQTKELREKSKKLRVDESTAADKIFNNDNISLMMMTFAKLANLYSVLVDENGKIVFSPTGPSTNLGDFYDLFEKPEYKEYYKYIKQMVLENDTPVVFDREEGGIGKISAAPLKINGNVKALWIIGSYTPEETARLKDVCESHWNIAYILSEYLQKSVMIDVEKARTKGAGKKLLEELTRQTIVNDALTKISSKLIDTVDSVIEETLRDVGVHMDIDKAFLYTRDNKKFKEYNLRGYWSSTGEQPSEDILVTIPDRMYIVKEGIKKGAGQCIIDNSLMHENEKNDLMRYNFKAIIVYPIFLNDKEYGYLFFVENKAERTWTQDELRFSNSIALVIQNMLDNAEGDDNIRKVNKHLIETYNNFDVGIFVRDAYSGEVLFSNSKMNEMLGYDFTGGDSREILTDLHDRFDNISGMRKPFITKEHVVNWKSYIQKMDSIMDITEVKIEWLRGEPASLIILRKAKDL